VIRSTGIDHIWSVRTSLSGGAAWLSQSAGGKRRAFTAITTSLRERIESGALPSEPFRLRRGPNRDRWRPLWFPPLGLSRDRCSLLLRVLYIYYPSAPDEAQFGSLVARRLVTPAFPR
jgi:hypothetical protein